MTLEDLLAQQEYSMNKIYRTLPNFKKLGQAKWTPAIIKQRISAHESLFAKCEELDLSIQRIATENQRVTINYFTTNQFYRCEEIYQEALDFMTEALACTEAPQSPLQSSMHAKAMARPLSRLPRIDLPSFDGSPLSWESFRDRFRSLIHSDSSLSDVEKLHYLMSSLKGDALRALQHLTLTDANYNVGWTTLMSRYENLKLLISKHLSTLFHLDTVVKESAPDLRNLYDSVNASVQALKNLKRPVEYWDDILVYLITQKLDASTHRAWELHQRGSDDYPTFSELTKFLELQIRALDAIYADGRQLGGSITSHKTHGARAKQVASHLTASTPKRTSLAGSAGGATQRSNPDCPMCGGIHQLFHCSQFLSAHPPQRLDFVKKHHRCYNCLADNHITPHCQSQSRCRVCFRKHHTLLHSAHDDSAEQQDPTHSDACSAPPTAVALASSMTSASPTSGSVLLATARVRVAADNGRWVIVRALLDQGSTATLISENLAQLLQVQRRHCTMRVIGVNGASSNARHLARISVRSQDGLSPAYSVSAIILTSLTRYQPDRLPCSPPWRHTRNLQLADDNPTSSEPIEIILGADIYGDVLRGGLRRGARQQPTAQNTIFGWVLSGRVTGVGRSDEVPTHTLTAVRGLDYSLRRFWEIEEIPPAYHLSDEDRACEAHFQRTHSRTPEGRYTVRLPFKTNLPIRLGPSVKIATQHLLRVERRLHLDETQASAYEAFMTEYQALGHMEQLKPGDESRVKQPYYIPHHAVFRQSSSTTKLRVVFNVSAVTSLGNSLNDCLAVGPKLQTDLSAVILRWRQFRYVYTADIEKMYRQIWMDGRDQDYQRIVWRPEPHSGLAEYRLKTVTYGTRPAPFLALRVLKQLAIDDGADYPLAVSVLSHQIYVDDCLFGADDRRLVARVRDQLIELLGKGGFHLRKWASNCPELLHHVDPHNHGLALSKELQPDDALHVLGISWHPADDTLRFPLGLSESPGNTKREMLSTIARFYDPLGWITPVLIKAKILLQHLWIVQCDWDDDLPAGVRAEWARYCQDLRVLARLTIPRWTGFSSALHRFELHAFADASTKAYAAAVYLRCVPGSGPASVTLLIAKSRVAPIKTLSVPRLELCAAHLLARLLDYVKTTLNMPDGSSYCWTDSAIVLAWVSKPPNHWQTFVANRVAAIQSLTSGASWRHVATHSNPADCASRGLILDHPLWWSGPEWLQLEPLQWPQAHAPSPAPEVHWERKPIATSHVVSDPEPWDLQSRYSSWPKLLRITALVARFIQRLRRGWRSRQDLLVASQRSNSSSPLSQEIQQAKLHWLRVVQLESFPQELGLFARGQSLPATHSLSRLSPFLDADGLLRVGGRLRHSNYARDQKHPVLLRSHPIVEMIVRHHHLRTLHGGPQLTASSLRHEYWILRARQLVRSTVHKCVPCTRERAAVPREFMGDLPDIRVNRSSRAFQHSGVDYAGPILVRMSSGRGHKCRKAYIALFICMTVKAVHLELVSDYSSAAFLAAYQRFVARRGLPTTMHSDNGTTFQGADKELHDSFLKATRSHQLGQTVAEVGTRWHFMPPAAPHFGGLWEAGVKQVKHHLRRCVGCHTLTFEELITLLCRIESCLNSRPLTALSDALDDCRALTPGHFLIGSPLLAPPEPDILHLSENRLTRWQLLQRRTQDFWKAWSSDYV